MYEDNLRQHSNALGIWKTADPELLTVLDETLAPRMIKSAFYVGEGRWPVLKVLKAHLGSNYSCSICEWISMELDEGHSFEGDPDYAGVFPGRNVVYEGIEPAELLIIEADHTLSSVNRLIKRMTVSSLLKIVVVTGKKLKPPSNSSLIWEKKKNLLIGRVDKLAAKD
jgi:hypothetical protein